MPVEHGAVHRGEGVAGDDGGLDGEFLDVRFGLLQRKRSDIITAEPPTKPKHHLSANLAQIYACLLRKMKPPELF